MSLAPFPAGQATRLASFFPVPAAKDGLLSSSHASQVPAGEQGDSRKRTHRRNEKAFLQPLRTFPLRDPRQGWQPARWQPPRYSRALLMICLMMRSVPTRVLSLLLSSLGRRKASTRSGNEQAAGTKPTVTDTCRAGTQPKSLGCGHCIPDAEPSRPT